MSEDNYHDNDFLGLNFDDEEDLSSIGPPPTESSSSSTSTSTSASEDSSASSSRAASPIGSAISDDGLSREFLAALDPMQPYITRYDDYRTFPVPLYDLSKEQTPEINRKLENQRKDYDETNGFFFIHTIRPAWLIGLYRTYSRELKRNVPHFPLVIKRNNEHGVDAVSFSERLFLTGATIVRVVRCGFEGDDAVYRVKIPNCDTDIIFKLQTVMHKNVECYKIKPGFDGFPNQCIGKILINKKTGHLSISNSTNIILYEIRKYCRIRRAIGDAFRGVIKKTTNFGRVVELGSRVLCIGLAVERLINPLGTLFFVMAGFLMNRNLYHQEILKDVPGKAQPREDSDTEDEPRPPGDPDLEKELPEINRNKPYLRDAGMEKLKPNSV